jgi:hypothetical protein
MLELERLQVRVVSGRLGRKGAGEEDDEDEKDPKKSGMPPITDPALLRRDSLLSGRDSLLGGTRRDSITGLLSAADMASGSVNRNNSLGWPGGDAGLGELMQRRSSSLGLSLMPDHDVKRRNSSLNLGGGLDGGDPSIPPHRPLVGGGSAAAYEAARADHYTNMAAQKVRSDDQQRRASGLGSLGAGGSQIGLSVNPNQHYEMLKLHHMNLLNEIQETTLMMNLYQQQQLQQQQQQLQQVETPAASSNDQMALLLQQQGMGGQGRMGSLGLGGGGGGTNASSASGDMQALLRQQQAMMAGGSGGGNMNAAKADHGNSATEDESALQSRLQALKDDIARHQKEAEELTGKPDAKIGGNGSASKRKPDDGGEGQDAKRVKNEGSD